MEKLLDIEDICKGLHSYENKENLIYRINEIHFLLLNYFLQLDNERIHSLDKYHINKLKEIGLYLFDLATDDMFLNNIEHETKRDLFDISLNIFEQLCKLYQILNEEYQNGFLELLLITVSCASLGDNPSKAYVIFNKHSNYIQELYEEDIYFYTIIAFFSKNYGKLNMFKKGILLKARASSKVNEKNFILYKIVESIFKTVNYFDTGIQELVYEIFKDLDNIYELASTLNYYREIWIIKKLQKYINFSTSKSLWYILNGHLNAETIGILIGSKSKPTYELWTHQIDIINKNLLDMQTHNIVNMPTSAGKSLIAQISILKVLQEFEDGTCIYIVPTNALLAQVKHDLNLILERLNIDIDILVSGYDIIHPSIELSKVNNSKVLIVTQEKLDSLIRREDPFINKCKLFIFDEFHNISSNSRGLLLEFVVTKIKMMNLGDSPKLLFLSAVLPNILKFKEWIGAEITKEYSNTDCRPTKQIKIISYYLSKNENPERGRYEETVDRGMRIFYEDNKYVKIELQRLSRVVSSKKKLYKTQNICADIAERFSKVGNVLVYLPVTNWFKSFCEFMAIKEIALTEVDKEKLNQIADYIALTMPNEHYLVDSIRRGVAYHHKRLPDNIKRIIEIAFKEGTIKVLAATSTLAQGLNFPITTIILGSLKAGANNMTAEEIENLTGRAGRAMRETEGYVILPISLKSNYSRKIHEKYIHQMKEEYLFKDINSIVINSSVKKLKDALNKQEQLLEKSEKEIIRMYNSIIFDLEQSGLLEEEEDYIKMINELFYGVDATEEAKEDLVSLTKSMVINIRSKINLIEDSLIRKILKNSGLSIDTAIGVYNAVINNFDQELDYVFINNSLNTKFIPLINDIKDFPEFKTNNSGEFVYDCLNSWIFMDNYKLICEKHFGGDFDKCIDFIGQDIIYKGSWYLSLVFQLYEVIFLIRNFELEFDWERLQIFEELSSLPAYCKYGVENKTMIELMENGIYERELLIKAVSIFKLHSNVDHIISEYFYEWTKHVNLITLENINVEIGVRDIDQWNVFKNSRRVAKSVNGTSYNIDIKAYGMYEMKDLIEGEPLILNHDKDNPHDKYAIEIMTLDSKKIGYLDKRYSQGIYKIMEETENVIWAFFNINGNRLMECKVIIIE